MNLSRPFILRPVATTLLMAALLLAGGLAYRLLPVSALPQVDYPTIQIFTFYPGASPAPVSRRRDEAMTPIAQYRFLRKGAPPGVPAAGPAS